MEIRIIGKIEPLDRPAFDKKTSDQLLHFGESSVLIDSLNWVGEGFVFVDYLNEDIFLGDVFILDDKTEITLLEIKLQFNTRERLTMMGHGWKCLCRFLNLNLENVPVASDWFDTTPIIIATRKTEQKQ